MQARGVWVRRNGSNDDMRALCHGLVVRLTGGRTAAWEPGDGALGVFALVNGLVSLALIGLAAALLNEPLLFPSLGPTAYLLSKTPRHETTTPHNIIVGHLIGAVSGYLALVVFGLLDEPSAFVAGSSLVRSGAAALSLGLTAAGMTWFDSAHAPAAATTLIVGLGILTTPLQLAVLMVVVVVLAYQGVAINRLAGLQIGWWR